MPNSNNNHSREIKNIKSFSAVKVEDREQRVLLLESSLSYHGTRAGLRHVRTVRPNRAADFKGAAFLDAKKFPYKLIVF